MLQERLLEIAIREFAAKGLEGASTRGIAAAAGTAMSSITYHYGGKEGLYLAAADYIAGEMDDVTDGLDAGAIVAAEDRDGARAAIKAILARMIDKLAAPRHASWSLFIVREQMHPTAAFDRIYDGAMGRMFDVLVDLVCVVIAARDRRAARIAVLTLFGQVVVLRAARGTCARLLGTEPDEAATVADFHGRIAANTDAVLDSMTIEQREALA